MMILFLLSCSTSKTIVISADGTETEEDSPTQEPSEPENTPSADIPDVDDELCNDAPNVTWDNWAQSLFITHCQGCHASSAPYRYGAPEDIHFDYESITVDQAERIWVRVIDEETMPPAGGILDDDLYLLEIWLRCNVGL